MPPPRRRTQADIVLPDPDQQGRVLLTGCQAAKLMGTTPRTIQQWRADGWLTEAGQEPAGRRRFVYCLDDVISADARARGIAA